MAHARRRPVAIMLFRLATATRPSQSAVDASIGLAVAVAVAAVDETERGVVERAIAREAGALDTTSSAAYTTPAVVNARTLLPHPTHRTHANIINSRSYLTSLINFFHASRSILKSVLLVIGLFNYYSIINVHTVVCISIDLITCVH